MTREVVAVFALLVGSSIAMAGQGSGNGPAPLNAPRGQTAGTGLKPIQNGIERLIRLAPAPRETNVGGGAPDKDHSAPTGVEHAPANAMQQIHRRAVDRGVARRIDIDGGVLVLPKVGYYGVPVILDVPQLGLVDVPEDEYGRLYEQLSSSDSQQLQEAMASLRRLKALEEEEVEALWHRERAQPEDTQDLSEPIFFGSPARTETRRKRPY